MSETRVDIPRDIFDDVSTVYIDDNGKVSIDAGLGRRVVGHAEDGNIYATDGFSDRKVLEGDERGNFYDPNDAGIYSRGSLVFSAKPGGSISDADGNYVGRYNSSLDDLMGKTDPNSSEVSIGGGAGGGSGFGVLIAVGIVAFLVIGSMLVYWGNVRPENGDYQSITFAVLLTLSFIGSTVLVWQDKAAIAPLDIAKKAVIGYLGGAFAYICFSVVDAAIKGALNIGNMALALIFTPIFMLGAGLPLFALQVLCFWLARKFE